MHDLGLQCTHARSCRVLTAATYSNTADSQAQFATMSGTKMLPFSAVELVSSVRANLTGLAAHNDGKKVPQKKLKELFPGVSLSALKRRCKVSCHVSYPVATSPAVHSTLCRPPIPVKSTHLPVCLQQSVSNWRFHQAVKRVDFGAPAESLALQCEEVLKDHPKEEPLSFLLEAEAEMLMERVKAALTTDNDDVLDSWCGAILCTKSV